MPWGVRLVCFWVPGLLLFSFFVAFLLVVPCSRDLLINPACGLNLTPPLALHELGRKRLPKAPPAGALGQLLGAVGAVMALAKGLGGGVEGWFRVCGFVGLFGGGLVEGWWRVGGGLVEGWWRVGGGLV